MILNIYKKSIKKYIVISFYIKFDGQNTYNTIKKQSYYYRTCIHIS